MRKVKWRIKGGAKEVTQLHLIGSYNKVWVSKGMGGVDLMDRLLESYRPTIRGKKYYWTLFINFLNVTVVAAWRIYCRIGQQKVSHLKFRRQVTLCLLKADEEPKNRPKFELPQDVRFDKINHFRGQTSQGRCQICKNNTKTMCKKFNVRLHAERGKLCFEMYHNK